MKHLILLGFLIISLLVNSQDFSSSDSCKADFKFAVNPYINSLLPATAINFIDKSLGDVKEWHWDFGDSIMSREQNPMIVFNHPIAGPTVKISPYRTVTLTISTSDGCTSTGSQIINIIDGTLYEQNQSCKAIFKYYESARDTSEGIVTINFNNYSEGENLNYFWQFGNGETSTEKEPLVKFKLNRPEYKVCLTVNEADGSSDMLCDIVHIDTILWDSVYVDPFEPECQVGFGYNMKDILMGPLPSMLIEFYYKSYPEAMQWHWDFGDGTTSNEPNPTHTYIQANKSDSIVGDSVYPAYVNPYRTVCLTVITEDTCKVSWCETIQVFGNDPKPEECKAYFKYYQPEDIITIPEVVPIQLVDVSEGDVVSREWVFEDGTTSSEKELLHMFNIFHPEHKVVLTVTFADSCINTYYGKVFLKPVIIDTTVIDPDCPYIIKVDGGFPIEMSSCAGWASARIHLDNELVDPVFINWSTGDTLAKVSGLCPGQTYSVKALMNNGCTVSTDFILSADGSITSVSPINWWLSGERDKLYVRSDAATGMKVEWRLCDGTIVEADSIPLDAINCGGIESNMIVKDSMGNVVYSEMIALKGSVTGIEDLKLEPTVKLWPNPVSDKLNIRYSGDFQAEILVDVCDVMGKRVSSEIYRNISNEHEFSINTESLKSGIYVCRISIGGKIIDAQKFSRR
jgi:PKD repeat protein